MAENDNATVAPPLIQAVSEAIKGTHAETTAHSLAARSEWLTEWLEAFEAEHAGVTQTVLKSLVDHPDMPQVVKDALAPVISPEHQTAVILGLFSVGSIVSQFVSAALSPLVQDVSKLAWGQHQTQILSPPEMAVAVLKGWVTQEEAAAEAAFAGIDSNRFDLLTKLNGEPPGPVQLMEALRRGYIDEDRFTLGIRESRVRPEWLDVLLKLRYSPLPVGTATAAAIEGHITVDQLATILNDNGLKPELAELLYETAGRPPGVFELSELVNRGELGLAEWEQAIRESDIKNKYIESLALLRRRIPPMRTVVAAVHQSVLSADAGIEKLMQLGYNHEDAAMLVSEATSLKHAANKELALGMIRELYTDQLIDRAKAHTLITNLGYDEGEVGFILGLADHARHYRYQMAGVQRVHNRYVSYRMERGEVVTSLDHLNIPQAAREDWLSLWDQERAANVPRLTLAEWQGAVRRAVITPKRFEAEVIKLGYPKADVPILYNLAWPPTQKAPQVEWT